MMIVGLGNPGEEYKTTRHNVGFMALDLLAKQLGAEFVLDKKRCAEVAKVKIGSKKVDLLKPQTFMNKSGNSLLGLVKNRKDAENLVVVHDDLDLPIGRLKISFNKSSGGHKGVESVIKAVKTEGIIRVRIGISPSTPAGKLKKPSSDKQIMDFIVAPFKEAELKEIKKLVKKAVLALESLVKEGREKTMGQFNQARS